MLQAADILLYRAHAVPVGEDQLPHLELTREIVRRLHALLKVKIFPEPKALLTEAPKLMGTDARKMSKSYGNTLDLSASAETIRTTVQKMFTDPLRIKMTDPGHPESCNVCGYWRTFDPDRAAQVWTECQTAKRGCVQNKQELAEVLIKTIEPFRAARKRTNNVDRILRDGAKKARAIAQETMADVKAAFGLTKRSVSTVGKGRPAGKGRSR